MNFSKSAHTSICSQLKHLLKMLSKQHYQILVFKKILLRYLVLIFSSSESSEERCKALVIYLMSFFFFKVFAIF